MNVVKQIKALCTPAYIYFSLSVISILVILGQNSLGHHTYVVGQRRVNLPHTNTVYFVVKIVGVLIWTYILQNLCKSGYKNIAWFLVLIPFFFLFFIVGAVLVYFADYKAEIKQMKYRAAYHPAMRRVVVRHPVMRHPAMHHSVMRYPAMHHSAMHHPAMRRGLTHHPAMRRGAMPMHH